MNTKLTVGAILLTGLLIAAAILYTQNGTSTADTPQAGTLRTEAPPEVDAVTVEEGVQYIDITARGGYTPKTVQAQAGMPTVIRMKTQNTYDCSSALVIPDLSYQTHLPPSGITEIEVSAEKATGTLQGMCSMAMYRFEIDFSS